MKLYGFGPARSARPLWVLRELGVPFEYVEVDLSRGEHRQPAFLAVNPYGRVPALQDGDLVMRESVAICLYLAERHPGAGLLPAPGTAARARHDQTLLFTVAELDAPLWRARLHRLLYPEERRIEAEIANAEADFCAAAAVLEDELGPGPHLLGARFSVADIVLAHTLHWATWTDMLAGFPRLQAYLATQITRPSCPDCMRP
jgi:glutathione S-transferase